MDKDKLGGLMDRYELYSPNIFIDPQYKALIQYVEDQAGQKKDDFCHETFDQESIKQLMEDQGKANASLRNHRRFQTLSSKKQTRPGQQKKKHNLDRNRRSRPRSRERECQNERLRRRHGYRRLLSRRRL